MGKGLMFGFVDAQTNPVAGRPVSGAHCPNDCRYCYARALKERHQWPKYQGPYRLDPKALKEYPDGHTVFLQDMGDIGDPEIPILGVIDPIARYVANHPKVTFLPLTKNPNFYLERQDVLGDLSNIIYGVTVETNREIPPEISKAPHPALRFNAMKKLREKRPDVRILVSVEPIIEFDFDEFLNQIVDLKPELVAVGYCNHGYRLPEPSLRKTMHLIEMLEIYGIKVHRKTLREAVP